MVVGVVIVDGLIGLIFWIVFFASRKIESSKAKSFKKESMIDAKIKYDSDIYYDYYGQSWYKNKKCFIGIKDGHKVCMSLNGKEIFKDYTQEELDKKWEKYKTEYEEEKKKAIQNKRGSILVNYPNVGLIKIELSTGQRIKTTKINLKGFKPVYYKYYYDSIDKETSWIDNKVEITCEEYQFLY